METTKANAAVSKTTGYFADGKVKDVNNYDYNGDLLAKSIFEYDSRGRLIDVNQAVTIDSGIITDWATTSYDYNDANNGFIVDSVRYAGVHIIDAEGQETTIANNEFGKPLKITYPSGKYEQAKYFGDGTVKEKLVFNSANEPNWIVNTYDKFNRITEVNYPDKGKLQYSYNGIGQLTQIIDSRAAVDNIGGRGKILYDYDSLGQLASVIEQDGFKTDYSWQADGQKQAVKVTKPGAAKQIIYWTKYYFDIAGRLKTVTEPLKGYSEQYTAGFDYDALGNRSRLKYFLDGTDSGHTVSLNYTYNRDNFLKSINTTSVGGSGPVFQLLPFSQIDGLGRLTLGVERLTMPDSSTIVPHTSRFKYDGLSQLVDANITNIGGSNWTSSYDYQYNGNIQLRTQNSEPSTQYSYNGDEMTMAGGYSLNYDLNGNLKTENSELTTQNYEYNWDNKLRSATSGSDEISLKYDPSGNRISKNSSVAGNRKYIVDIAGDLPTILLELEPLGSNQYSIRKTYVYANSQILSENDNTGKYFYLHDRLGSVRQVINSDGSVVKLLTYNPFGETLEEEGDFYTPWQFTGQYLDQETGQYYLRARQYSPYLARFTGRDLIMGKFEEPMTLHKYLYCGNNPLNFVDLNGLWAFYATLSGMFQSVRASGVQIGFVIDGEGNVGIITIENKGLGSPQLSTGVSFGYSYNAKDIYALEGSGTSVGVSTGGVLGVEIFMGKNAWGLEIALGASALPIPEGHYYYTNTVVEQTRYNWRDMLNSFNQQMEESMFEVQTLGDFYKWAYFDSILENINAGRPPKIQME